jgi:hydroxylamine oxidation protein HaoB
MSDAAGKSAEDPAREAYVVIHVTDLYKLGLMRPEQFDIAYKSFPMEGNMHGMIGYLKKWMQENNYETYTLQSLSDSMVRGYFLRDAKSSNTLIAQMLPFTNSMPLDLTVLQLIYQQGGYWVYKLPATPVMDEPAPVAGG